MRHLLHNNALAHLLSLAILIASVSVASHVHAEHDHAEHDDFSRSEQVEDCSIYHQLQSPDQSYPEFISLFQASETQIHRQSIFAQLQRDNLLPPARAPPQYF